MPGFAQIPVDRIDKDHQSVEIVVGVIDAKGRRIVASGSLNQDDKRALNGDTVFEIGSMAKVFTPLALMDMAQRGELAVTDPVSKFLPASVTVPERNGKKITFEDLSAQSSGLPRMPSNFSPNDPLNPTPAIRWSSSISSSHGMTDVFCQNRQESYDVGKVRFTVR